MGAALTHMHAAEGVCEDEVGSKLRLVVGACSVSLVVVGLVVLLGWLLGIERVTDVAVGHVSMKPNTAIGFIVAGLGLAAHRRQTSAATRFTRWMGMVALLLGGLSVAEYVFAVDLRMDQLLFVDRASLVYPGRMAYLTAINFCLAGAALLLCGGSRSGRRIARVAAVLLTLDAFAAILGFYYGVEMFYGSTVYTAMAIHTGVAFLLLGIGIVLSDSDSTLVRMLCAPESGGVLLRRSLVGVILLPVVLGWVYLQPAVNFGHLRLGMALFAVTLVSAGAGAVWWVALGLTRNERQREEVADHRRNAESAERESVRLGISNQMLKELATTDPLTGLNNRRAFEEQMGKAISFAKRRGLMLSVLMMDIDHFKMRNDTWGHAAGDEVLRRIGALLLGTVREPDVVARFGGEEFLVLLPGSDTSQAQSLAERIRQCLAEQEWSGAPVTLSIGVAAFLQKMTGSDELLRAADAALYEAKRAGRDRVCVAEQSGNAAGISSMSYMA